MLTGYQMNYAIVYLSAILLCAGVGWYAYGKKTYTGPIIEAHIDEGISNDIDLDRSSDESMRHRKMKEKDGRPELEA